jgi:cytochrome c556
MTVSQFPPPILKFSEDYMQKKLFAIVLALALAGGYCFSAFAQAKPDAQVKMRQGAMTLQGKYFGPLGLMNAGKVPYNADVVARNAGFLDSLSQMPWDGFTEDTKGEKSRALPEIYSNPTGWKTAQDNYRGAVGKLVAAKGNEAGSKAAIKEVQDSCGACHKSFRGQ